MSVQSTPPQRPHSSAGRKHDLAWDIWTRLRGVYLYLLHNRALRKPAPHELDFKTAAQAFGTSLKGFARAAMSPYVIDKFIK